MHLLTEYDKIIAAKVNPLAASGFEPFPITAPLFPWQRVVVEWAVRQGRAALFAECGLGKTPMQLEWAHQVCQKTHASVLILAPLAVAAQTVSEGKKFGIFVNHAKEQSEVRHGINITNYERLDNFDASFFAGVVLDESSILKSFNGTTRKKLTAAFERTPFKLCCTATPSPNDYSEFGQHAEFLNICLPMQMLATYFINDTFNTGDWRLKRHAEIPFWEWVGSWAACVSKPSDIGFSDDGYVLPKLNLVYHQVATDHTVGAGEELFRHATMSATTMHKEMRLTCDDRVAKCAELVNGSDETWVVWCNTNYEADALKAAIPDAIEVRGSDSPEVKESRLTQFTEGRARVIVTKASIAGYGLNWQNCRNQAFVGLSYSFEDFYQATRRLYRFGQTREVNCHIIQAETEGKVRDVILQKIEQHQRMQTQMKFAAKSLSNSNHERTMNMDINEVKGQNWTMYNGDCVRVCSQHIASDSVGLSVFSPPFADLFTYSNDVQDMGNCTDLDAFMVQFGFLIEELMRVTMPGRECAVHCCDLLATKWKDGNIEYKDFSGKIVTAFRAAGWLLHSKITIWKDPVTEMQRTKAHGLLYKTLRQDSSSCRVGSPDYLLVFRKPGKNPVPIDHTADDIPLERWQQLASPVWMNIDQGNVLNGREAKEQRDERHICPLQLDVINNALTLWSAPGDLVFSPFAGIGSEGYCAVKMKRKFIGAELKRSYFETACHNLRQGVEESVTLFDLKN